MADDINSWLREVDFNELLNVFFNNNYYEIVFPFLLIYAVLYTILGKVKIFQNKQGNPYKSIITIISLVISFFAVSFETAPGYTIGKFLMMLFPNISSLTIMILGLYIVSSMFGKNFFTGLFRKDHSAYMYFVVGVIGLGSVLYYLGIVMGFWDQYPINQESQWNMIIAIGLLIAGITFLFIDLIPFGIVLLLVFGIFVYNYGQEGSILEYFIDPVILIFVIVIALLAWMNSDKEKKDILNKNIYNGEKSLNDFEKKLGRKPKDYEAKIYDIVSENLKNNKKKLEKFKKSNK